MGIDHNRVATDFVKGTKLLEYQFFIGSYSKS